MKDKFLHIRISGTLSETIKKLAISENKSVSEYVTDLIKADKIRKEIKIIDNLE